MAQSVAENAADVGILNHGGYGERVTLLPYREDELVLIVPVGHALARRQRDAPGRACPTFVGMHPGSAINNLLTRCAARLDMPLEAAHAGHQLRRAVPDGLGRPGRGCAAARQRKTYAARWRCAPSPWPSPGRAGACRCACAQEVALGRGGPAGGAPARPDRGGHAMTGPLRWDIFCQVANNHGDIGVCWRLAAELGARSHCVRL